LAGGVWQELMSRIDNEEDLFLGESQPAEPRRPLQQVFNTMFFRTFE